MNECRYIVVFEVDSDFTDQTLFPGHSSGFLMTGKIKFLVDILVTGCKLYTKS